MTLNTNNNIYTLVYASVVVVVVAFLLSFVSKVLEPQSMANERIDKKKQILASLNIRNVGKDSVEAVYARIVRKDEIINASGAVVKTGDGKDKDGFNVQLKEINANNLPVFICKVGEGDGGTKYVLPLTGKGLWGPIWGYIALDSDLRTVYGAYFTHEGETAGLGARITEQSFQDEFKSKKITADGSSGIALSVVKNGNVKNRQVECDGITGATLTSNGVDNMLKQCLGNYKVFLNLNKQREKES